MIWLDPHLPEVTELGPLEGWDAVAKALWDAAPARQGNPAWEQLGDATKGVWLARAKDMLA